MSPEVRAAAGDQPHVILWAPIGRDTPLASTVLERARLPCVACKDITELCAAARDENAGLLILAEEALHFDAIQQLREVLDRQPPWSALPLIILTGGGISTEASLNKLNRMRVLGNITLLERPLRTVTLVAAAQSALAARSRQFETRDYINELEEAKTKLAQANADLRQFAFAASHDLQEPLRMVKVFTQLLLQRYVDRNDPKASEFADYIASGATRMELLLRDLLQYSRAVHEDRDQTTVAFNLASAVADATEALKLEIDESHAQIVSGPMPEVLGDPAQLSLVFQNLLSNSIKYVTPGVTPVIEIWAHQNGGRPVIHVKDNGIGFQQKYAERVFDLFQRLGDIEVPGTGLGLAICRRIIERHGGHIWAESRPGEGATFLFTLPSGQETQ